MLIADGTFNEYDISFEDICLKINPRVGSRTSIQNIIKVGIEKNYFIKNPSLSDNRKKVLLLSDLGKKYFPNGPGSIFTIRLKSGYKACVSMVENVKLFSKIF